MGNSKEQDRVPINWLVNLEAMTPETAISERLELLRSIFHSRFECELDFDSWLDDVAAHVKSGAVGKQTIENEWGLFLTGEGRRMLDIPFRHSAILVCMAQHALTQCSPDKVWPLLHQASYYAGIADASAARNDATYKDLTSFSSAGGKERWAPHKKVRDELTRILSAPPNGGWCDQEDTVDQVMPELETFIEREKIDATLFSDLGETVVRWLKSHAEVRAMYESHRNKN